MRRRLSSAMPFTGENEALNTICRENILRKRKKLLPLHSASDHLHAWSAGAQCLSAGCRRAE